MNMRHIAIVAMALALGGAEVWGGKGGKPGGGPPADPAIAYRIDKGKGKSATRALMVMNDDGSNARELLSANNVAFPSWSPDGTELAFYSDVQGSGIYVIGVDGTGLRKVLATSGGVAGIDWSPVPAADGNYKISFGAAAGGGWNDLFVVNLDGSGLENLTQTADRGEGGGTWSPDATRLAVSTSANGQPNDIEVFELGTVGGALAITGSTALNLSLGLVGQPCWARTADRIAFTALPAGATSLDLWVVDLADPANPVNITNTAGKEERFPTWSPDDARMAFWVLGGQEGVHVMPSDGSGSSTRISSGFMPSWRRNP